MNKLKKSLLQDEQTQLSQPISLAVVLQPPENFCGILCGLFQQVYVLPVLESSNLYAALQVRLNQSRGVGQNPPP